MQGTWAKEGWAERVLNPAGKAAPTVTKLANRLHSLEGATIGLFDNYKPNADVILQAAREVLIERYKIEKFVYITNQHSDPITQDQLRQMKEADAVLVASAD